MKISENIFLQELQNNNYGELYELMYRIYPPEYNAFWKDDCSWYINNQYSKNNFQKELLEENQRYFFVIHNDKKVGILRLLFDENPEKISDKKCLKLHRIYLDNKIQGKGIGTAVLKQVDEIAKENNCAFVWLEAMEKKPLAIQFYQRNGYQQFDEYFYEFDLLRKDYQKMMAFHKKLI